MIKIRRKGYVLFQSKYKLLKLKMKKHCRYSYYNFFSGDLKSDSEPIILGIGAAVALVVSILAIFLLLPMIKNTKRTLSLDFDVRYSLFLIDIF